MNLNMTDNSTNILVDNNSSKRMHTIKNAVCFISAFLISIIMPVFFAVLYLETNGESYMSIPSLVTASIFVSVLSFCLAYHPLNKMTIKRLKVLKVVCAILTFLWSGFCVLFMSMIANA